MKSFFIAGVQRSGTTLLSVLLSKHPEIHLDGYSRAFRIISCFKGYYDVLPHNLQHDKAALVAWMIENDYKGMLAELLDYENIDQYEDVRALLRASIEQMLAKQGKTVWGDKSPNLQYFLPDLLMLLPETKIVHMVRDGRATAYSLASRSHKYISMAAQEWVNGNIFGMANQHLIGDKNYMLVKYEELIEQPEQTMRQVCDFLEISFSPQLLDLSDEQTPEEVRYVKSTFDPSKINRYAEHLSERDLKKIERIQGPLLERLGYQLRYPELRHRHRPLPLVSKIWLLLMEHARNLFRGKRMGMVDRKNVVVKISLKSRIYNFCMKFTQELFSEQIFKALFPRVFYRQKYFRKPPPKDQADIPSKQLSANESDQSL